MTPQQLKTSPRELRRLQTRERILGAAIAEFQANGMSGADIGEIVASAGVAHGTFFFHFPSKEHVLLELEKREEQRMATELEKFLDQHHPLTDVFTEAVRLVAGLENRFGARLFRDLLALHFSPSRPTPDTWTAHPVIVLLVREIERVRDAGLVHPDVAAIPTAVFFLLSVYGLLSTVVDEGREAMLASLIDTVHRGLATQ